MDIHIYHTNELGNNAMWLALVILVLAAIFIWAAYFPAAAIEPSKHRLGFEANKRD